MVRRSQPHAFTPAGKGFFSLRSKLLCVVTMIVAVITIVNIALSSYLTYTQNEGEARQKLALQFTLLQRDLKQLTASVMHTAEEVGNNTESLTELGTLYGQYAVLDKYAANIMFFKTPSLTRLQTLLGASNVFGVGVYVENRLSHYMTREAGGAEVFQQNEPLLVGRVKDNEKPLDLKLWRTWKALPPPAMLPPALEIPKQITRHVTLTSDALIFQMIVPIQGIRIEQVMSDSSDISVQSPQTASPEAFEAQRQQGKDTRIIGGFVVYQRVELAFLADKAETTDVLPSIASADGQQQFGTIIFPELPDVVSQGTGAAQRSEIFTILRSSSEESHYAMFASWQVDEKTALLLGVSLSRQSTIQKIRESIRWIAGVSLLSLLVVLAVGGVFVNRLIRPIQSLSLAAQQVSQGDLEIRIKVTSRDEIGELAHAFQHVLDYFRAIADVATQIAKGDLSREIVPHSDRDSLGLAFQGMTAYLNEMAAVATAFAEGDLRPEVHPRTDQDVLGKAFHNMKAIRQIMRQIIESARQLGRSAANFTQISAQLASGAEETALQVQTVSANSQQINQNMNQVSAATEEFAASIQEVSRNVAQVAKIATTAVEAAQHSNTSITELEGRSAEIGNISKVITAITQQTNLLALNATIEAARAGEVGRGFVVVANEVKELAHETARATDDIIAQIEAIQAGIQETKAAMTDVSEVIGQVHTLSASITCTVEQQAATTREVSRNISDVALGSDEITNSISEVTAVAHDASEHAGTVQHAAQELFSLAEQLRELVEQFKI